MENIHIHSNDEGNFKNGIEENVIPLHNSKRKIKSGDRLIAHKKTNFEKKVSKLFDKKKFKLSNKFNQKNSEIFLKEKDECMKEMNLEDSIPLNKKKRLYYSKIKKNSNKLNSFYSVASSEYVKEIVDLLK